MKKFILHQLKELIGVAMVSVGGLSLMYRWAGIVAGALLCLIGFMFLIGEVDFDEEDDL